MKKLLIVSSLLMLMFPLVRAQEAAPKDTAEITFEKKVLELGTVKPGAQTMEFVFTNTGKGILTLNNVQPTCGCTIADYPKEPIKPGQKGTIKATFNGHSVGHFTKSITVLSNAKTPVVSLTFNVNVADPAAETANTQTTTNSTTKTTDSSTKK